MKTRDGRTAEILGPGPLTKTFLLVRAEGVETDYLVWEKDRRYRQDFDEETKEPVPHDLDLV